MLADPLDESAVGLDHLERVSASVGHDGSCGGDVVVGSVGGFGDADEKRILFL